MRNDKIFSVRSMVFMAIFAAILCVISPYSIKVGPIPITFATFGVYLAGAVLGGKRAVISVVVYILLGATGGYLIGYVPLALITGIFADMKTRRHWTMIIGMILGTVALYTFGTAWYMIFSGANLVTALLTCVVPFLIGDGIKMACTTAIAMPLKSRLNAIMYNNRKEG